MVKVFSTHLLSTSEKEETAQKGIEITDRNFIRIVPVVDQSMQRTLSSALHAPYQTILFTSKNAVKIAFAHYFSDTPEPILQTWRFYCLSGATREVLLQYIHPEQILESAGYASDLAPMLKKPDTNLPLHFFCGNKRRDTLPLFMQSHHLPFKEWKIYETIAAPSVVEDEYQGYLFYSPSAAVSFFMKNKIAADTPCFTIGKTTAATVRSEVSNPVFPSSETNTPALLKLLEDYFKDNI